MKMVISQENSLQWLMKSPIGPLYLVASEKGLQGVFWNKGNAPFVDSLNGAHPALKILKQTVRQLEEYFKSERREFDLPFDTGGTDFQKKVWAQLALIPYGKTVSYSDIAKRIKNGKAVRAVGTANGKNPLSIIVPCHRVIQGNGTLGGYAGGLQTKTKLLELEQKSPRQG
jgi:methylated-DNA-[protein]-cysteine S-methyltransferase